MREPPPPPPPLIADVVPDDGISWARIVTAIVLLALSMAIGYRTGREPPRPKAVPQPVHERVVAGVELAPLSPTGTAAPQPSADVVVEAESAAPESAAERAEPPAGAERPQVSGATKRPPARVQAARASRHHRTLAAHAAATVRRSVRTRAQVRGEYLRQREVVAAFTGEDSGSAYLSRMAERRRAQRLERAGHRT